MSITIELPSKTESQLRKRARHNGQDFDDFVRKVLEREAEPTLAELLKPIHDETKRLGLTEHEIEELIDSELAEVRRVTPLFSR